MASPVPPVDKDAAPASTPIESSTSIKINEPSDPAAATPTDPIATPNADLVKVENSNSPAPSRLESADAETPGPDGAGDNGRGTKTTAGRKRKLNSMSARGVANLTPDQLAKKRNNDRLAQRAIRERTKFHIDALEHQVQQLSSQKPVLDLQAALRRNDDMQAENRELRQGLKSVMDVVQPLLGKPGPTSDGPTAIPSVQTQTQPVQPQSSTTPVPENNRITPNSQRSATGDQSYPESLMGTPSPSGTRRSSADGAASFRVAFDSQRHNLNHGLDLGEERLGFNFLVDAAQSVPNVDGSRRNSENRSSSNMNPLSVYAPPLNTSVTDQPSPAHLTPIRNVAPTCPLDVILLDFLHHRQQEAAQGVPKQNLVGPPYPSVSSLLNPEKSVYSHPLSKVFTDILRTFPNISSLPEQVAVLYVMFLLMRWQIYPTPENYDRLPEWLTPRPSQLLTPHPAWVDYLPWPRMRDRIVMAHHEYPFENWFVPFTEALSVNWPYEATDCLLSTNDCEEMLMNPVFERHLRNLNNWSVGPAFAEAY